MEVLNSKFEKLGLQPANVSPTARQVEWMRREKMIFFHFGMNTFTDREWGDGTENPSTFNPECLDCRQWIKTVRDAGFTAAILTAKHHDGFCLWPSKYTEHSIKNSPYKDGKGDIVREFTDACAEFGIKAGIYLSPWDRHEKTWSMPEYNDFYTNQLTELLTNYGKIWEVWWDGAGSTEADYDWARWATTVRRLQPDAVIFGSLGAEPFVETRWVGNERGIAGNPCWCTVKSETLITETTSELNSGDPDGNRFIPAEADVSIRPGWFYHKTQDKDVRDISNLMKLWFNSCGRNSGLLLNLPPDKRGLVHENDAQSLLDFNRVLTNTLSNNLAKGSKASADSVINEEICKADNILTDDINEFYAAADNTPEIIITLNGEKEFNAFVLQEVIELGHRVSGFEIAALVDNEWKTLYKGECIGYRQASHFRTVRTDTVRIKINSSFDVPVLRFFGLYRFDEALLVDKKPVASDKNLLDSETAVITKKGNAIDINLGGVYPFNHIDINTDKKFDVMLFNGFDFEPYATDIDRCLTFRDPIMWCYRIKIVFKEENPIDDVMVGIYLK
ncbi:MAG: alpha-L-fucosidase [Clostridia bacterium]|nr:alpha-L-fucosidase [Clostridia bacterium]